MICEKWFSVGCQTDEDREKRRIAIGNARGLLNVLDTIIQRELETLDRQQLESFQKPNWTENQARILGAIKALRDLRQLTKQELTP